MGEAMTPQELKRLAEMQGYYTQIEIASYGVERVLIKVESSVNQSKWIVYNPTENDTQLLDAAEYFKIDVNYQKALDKYMAEYQPSDYVLFEGYGKTLREALIKCLEEIVKNEVFD